MSAEDYEPFGSEDYIPEALSNDDGSQVSEEPMPKPNLDSHIAEIDQKLEAILKREQEYVQQCTLANIEAARTSGQWIIHDSNRAEALKEIKALIASEVEAVIGEDETEDWTIGLDGKLRSIEAGTLFRNNLREDQRKTLKERMDV